MDGENNGKPENPIKMDDLGVPLFLETPMYFCSTLFKSGGNHAQSYQTHWWILTDSTTYLYCEHEH